MQDVADTIEIIKSFVKRHPRWDPLRKEPADDRKRFMLNGVNFEIQIADTGLAVYVIFNERILLKTTDGLHDMDDSSFPQQNIINQYMPTLNMGNLPRVASFPYPSVDKYLLLYVPYNRFDVFLYDPNWIWNHFIPDIISYDVEDRGTHFLMYGPILEMMKTRVILHWPLI